MVADEPRKCFYALTAKNTISIYRTNGDKSIQHIQTLTGLYKAACDRAPGSPVLIPQKFEIIALHVINQNESRTGVQLVAITVNGVRLYFGPGSAGFGYGYGSAPSTSGPVRQLQLVHVRLPPPNLLHPDEQSSLHRPSMVSYGISQIQPSSTSRPYILSRLENSCYQAGLSVAAQTGDVDGTDYLLCMAPDLTKIGSLGQLNGPLPPQQTQYGGTSYGAVAGPSRPQLTEHATLLSIPGRTWGMAPVPRRDTFSLSSTPPNTPQPVVTNELATQFTEPPRQFMILTNVGLTFLAKRRAVDYLKDVIEEYHLENNAQPLMEFRDR